jgi:Domain of unknown function (DUF4365)
MVENHNPIEDLGYAFVQHIVASAGAIWRRQPEKDVGVDGLIEIERRDGASAYVAVQVKAGKSYFGRIRNGRARIHLGSKLQRLNNMTLPAIIVLYDPEDRRSCWENIQHYVLEHPAALTTGYIDVPLDQRFDAAAIEALRQEARTIMTPVLSRDEVAEFLNITTHISMAAFVPLAQSVLNKSFFRSRTGLPPIDLLASQGLIEIANSGLPGPPFWRHTDKGARYVRFLLGDRYFIPFALLEPDRTISESDIYLCMNFEAHLVAAQAQDEKRIG